MPRQDFWFHPECRDYGMIPSGTRWGPWLFLSALTPVNLDTGELVRTLWDLPPEGQEATVSGFEFMDARVGPAKAQTWIIYSNLSKILAQQGSSLDQVVRQRIYLRDVNHSAAVEDVMLRFFPGAKPATTMQGIPSHGLQEGLLIQVEIIALTGAELTKETITVPELRSMTAPYPSAVKVGDFLFTSGITGINLETGRAASKLEELGDDTKEVATGRVLTDATAELTKVQFWLTFRHIQRILESQGATLGNLLHTNVYVRPPWAGIIYTPLLQPEFFDGRESMPTITGFLINTLHIRDDVRALADAIALVPGSLRKQIGLRAKQRVGLAPMWARAGPFWFVSGALAADPATHKVIGSFADLSDEGRWLAERHPAEAGNTMAQALYIYRKLELGMSDIGSNASQVLQQNIYMRDVSDYPAVERIASMVYNGAIPPTTVVPVENIGPYDDLRLEIETITLVE